MNRFKLALLHHEKKGLLRNRSPENLEQKKISFISNDYLALARHPLVIKACQEGLEKYGLGSRGSQFLGGYSEAHATLESSLADFFGQEKCLLFSSGYLANISTLKTFIQKEDFIFEHRLNHSSLLEGARGSGAKIKRFKNLPHLESLMRKHRAENSWIITEGVFSMEGATAPLPEIIDLAKKFGARIILDDAHGIGVLGQHGRGSLEHYQLPIHSVDILIGTFGKAFGTEGAFVLGKTLLIEYLEQFSKGLMYSTALSPAICHATQASLSFIKNAFEERRYLKNLIKSFRAYAKKIHLDFLDSETPIQIIIIGGAAKTLQVGAQLASKGFLVGTVRPPTVLENTSRLRVNLNISHRTEEIEALLKTLRDFLCR